MNRFEPLETRNAERAGANRHPVARSVRRSATSGFVLIAALTCLVIVSVVFGLTLRLSVARHVAVRHRQTELQARFLTESGIDRGAARLELDPDYLGETWHVDATELDGRNAAVVEIQIMPHSENPQLRRIRVSTNYPSRGEARVRHTKQIDVHLPHLGEES